ncbi:MAG TPA: tetratricopeptide repeat protein, partial [Longimicrobiaceae bacterium]|nr:tetratricopeptide repeat protein [Longimicrobiaceae bacterium]
MIPRGRSPWFLLTLLAAVLLLPVSACAQQGSAESALREGRYEEAIRIWGDRLASDPADVAVRRSLATALIDVGRYGEAARTAGSLHLLRGQALRAIGRIEEAEAAFREAVDAGGPDRWPAELQIAQLAYERGDVDHAITRFDRFIDLYNGATGLSPAELTAVGEAVWYLGIEEPQLF